MPRVVLVTGLQAAGKTTVGRLLASQLPPPAAAFDGDVLYEMVVSGQATMSPDPSDEAVRQLRLRYRGSALLAQHYAGNGVSFVCSEIIVGPDLTGWLDSIHGADRHLVVLVPSVAAIAARERARGHGAYQRWQRRGASLEDAIAEMSPMLASTPRRGLWLDTSELTAEQAVRRILADDMRESRY